MQPNKFKKASSSIFEILKIWPFISFLIFIPISGFWAKSNFGSPTFEQLLFTLSFEPAGLLSTEPETIANFKRQCVFIPMGVGFSSVVIMTYVKTLKGKWDFISKTCRLCQRFKFLLFFFLYVASISVFLHQFSFFSYAKSFLGIDYIAQNYIQPVAMPKKSNAKNLVIIYVESFETGYRSTELFGKNLLAMLDGLPMKKFSFANYRQSPGTGWTIAAHVSTQCGIPLKVVLHRKNINTQGDTFSHFLPNASCLGDLLHEKGYRNVYLQSGSLSFAGTDKLWTQHGYKEAYGGEYLQTLGYKAEGWGVTDDKTLIEARKMVDKLQGGKEPFSLTITLVDTHRPEGILSDECKARGYSTLEGIVECTSQMVAEFIRFLDARHYTENTNIVVLGDHLLMPSRLTETLSKTERSIFNVFISKDDFIKNREDILHFDLFPTFLSFAGFNLPESGRAALGYSGLGTLKEPPPKLRMQEMENSLLNQSARYAQFWF